MSFPLVEKYNVSSKFDKKNVALIAFLIAIKATFSL
jgi:hypothetical protein